MQSTELTIIIEENAGFCTFSLAHLAARSSCTRSINALANSAGISPSTIYSIGYSSVPALIALEMHCA